MTIVQLEYLIALNKYRNYSRAAEFCNVTQPTLSMQLKKLEDTFGNQLIKKGKFPVEFTLLGKNVIQQAKVILQEFENLKYIQNKSKEDFKLQIHIGVIPTIATYLIPKLASKLEEILSDVTINFIELKTDYLIEAVNEMDVDYGIISGPYEGRLKMDELFIEPILIYAENENKKIDLKDLSGEKTWFLTKGNCFRMQMIRLCNNVNEKEDVSINYEGESLGTLINMVDSVGGYTMLPKYYIKYTQHDPGKIKQFSSLNPARSVVGISRKRNAKTHIIEQINNLIKQEYRSSLENPLIVDWR